MKKIILCLLLCVPIIASAQRYSKQTFVGGSIGGRFFAPLYAIALSSFTDGEVRITASPSVILNMDRQLGNRISLGLSASYSNIFFQLDDVTLFAESQDFRFRLHQFALTFRPLIHYGFNEKRNFYSGLRIGQQYNLIDKDQPNNSFFGTRSFNFINLQILPVGYRRTVNERWGYHIELGFGAPHSAAFGIQYTPGAEVSK